MQNVVRKNISDNLFLFVS